MNSGPIITLFIVTRYYIQLYNAYMKKTIENLSEILPQLKRHPTPLLLRLL